MAAQLVGAVGRSQRRRPMTRLRSRLRGLFRSQTSPNTTLSVISPSLGKTSLTCAMVEGGASGHETSSFEWKWRRSYYGEPCPPSAAKPNRRMPGCASARRSALMTIGGSGMYVDGGGAAAGAGRIRRDARRRLAALHADHDRLRHRRHRHGPARRPLRRRGAGDDRRARPGRRLHRSRACRAACCSSPWRTAC